MAKPTREFSADVGQKSMGVAGPDFIEHDLDKLFAMFDPNKNLPTGEPGGIGSENMKPGAVTAAQIGALVSVDGVSNPGGDIDFVAGAGMEITPDATGKKITFAARNDSIIPGPHAETHRSDGSDPITPADIGATATPTADRIAMYDSAKRLSSGAAPTSDNHVVRKVDLDSHINSDSAHSATATPTASKIAMYDSEKRLSSGAAPTDNNHVIRKIDIDNIETVNFTHGVAYVIRNFVHLRIIGGAGEEGEIVTILPSSIRPITNIYGVAFITGPGAYYGSASKLFSIEASGGRVKCHNKSKEEDVYISAFYIKG